MRVRIITLLNITLLFTACKKNDNTEPEPPVQYLASIVDVGDTYADDSTVYEYNSDMTLKRTAGYIRAFGMVSSYSLTYENGRLTKIVNIQDANPNIEYVDSFFYNNAGQVSAVRGGITTDSLVYNSKGQVITRYYTDWIYKNIFYYTWNDDNVVKSVYIDNSFQPADTATTIFTYDSKRNMFKPLEVLRFNSPDGYPRFSSKNNVTSERTTHSKWNTTGTTLYEYEYNDKHYPVSYKVTNPYGYSGPIDNMKPEEAVITYL
jgi:hypothetical protein